MKVKNRTIKTILVATGVIFFWRGMWGLMDLLLFPENPYASFVVSLVAGVLLLKATHHFFDQLM